MKSLLTPLFSKFLVEDTKAHLGEESNSYITIGRSTQFGVVNAYVSYDAGVKDVNWSTNERNAYYKTMVGAKKIAASDMQPVVARRDWANNTFYDAYADHIELFSYLDQTTLGTATVNSVVLLDGTVNIASGSNVVVGSGTSFSTYVFPTDQILINLTFKTVVSVVNNTHLVVNSSYANTNTGTGALLGANGRLVYANSANFTGNVFAGNLITIGTTTEDTREVVAVRSNKVLILNSNSKLFVSNSTIRRTDNTYPYSANTFYIRNNRDQVFKCLFNANTANSTIEPTIDIDGQLPENPFITTSDGYKWKYMYTIPPGLKQKFFNRDWMPVISDGAVTAAAENGRLDIVNVLWGGSGYISGGNSNTSGIVSVTNTDGVGANLVARVINGNITSVTVLTGGNSYTTGTVTVTDPNRLPDIVLGGTLNVSGTVVVANTSNTANQQFTGNVYVNDIITINGESRNVVTVTNATHLTVNTGFTYASNTQVGLIARSNAQFDLQFSPYGGHGSNPLEELGCHSLMLCVELEDTENETIPISDSTNSFDFNQVGIVVQPKIANGAYVANATNYRLSTRLEVSNPSSVNFTDDETVYIGSSIETANAVANVAHWAGGDNYLYINNITGNFEALQTIKGVTSGASVPILGISNSELQLFSGELIYIENRPNVLRKDNQIDQIKVILSF